MVDPRAVSTGALSGIGVGQAGAPGDLAQAILALSEAATAALEADSVRLAGSAEALAQLLELASEQVQALSASAWVVVGVEIVRELATVVHLKCHGAIPSAGDAAVAPLAFGELHQVTLIDAPEPGALGVAGSDPIGPVWVVPFSFEPAGRGWLALPATAMPPATEGVSAELRAFVAHLGLVVGQVVLSEVVRSTRTMYRTLVEQLPAVTYYRSIDTPGAVSFMSPQVEALTGYTAQEWASDPGLFARLLHPEDRVWVLPEQALFSPEDTTRPIRKEYRVRHRDGRTVWVENTALAVRDEEDRARFVMGLLFDITERKALEASLREAQKLEAVGKLAGGVAHDFNNMLSVILGWVADLKHETAEQDPRRRSLEEIERAAERARALTHKLLAFGRRQMLELRAIHLDVLVAGIEATMHKLVGDGVTLDVRLSEVPAVRVDAGQIEQVLLNIVANARDAMPRGGTIEIEVFAATRKLVGVERETVCVAVRDEGGGVDAVTRARIFEPFFTTKERTRNTGLGLSTALGVVQQCGGHIDVQSLPGRGATFTVVLPVSLDPESDALAELRAPTPLMPRTSSPRTIMVVADDDQMRRLLVMLLRRLGHRAQEARDAETSLHRVAEEGAPDLAMVDLAGPGTGLALATRLRGLSPDLPLILLSTLTDASVVSEASALHAPLVRKPFTMKALIAALEAALTPRRGE